MLFSTVCRPILLNTTWRPKLNFGCKQKDRAVIFPSNKETWSKGTWEKLKQVSFLCHFHFKARERRLYFSFSLENRSNPPFCSSFNFSVHGLAQRSYGCGVTFWQRFWLASPFSFWHHMWSRLKSVNWPKGEGKWYVVLMSHCWGGSVMIS